jgi:hypothetical protein
MIDTVRFSQTWKLRPDIPQTWKSTTHTYDHVDETQTQVARRRWLLTHESTGLRAVGSGNTIEYVECSLPRLLHGTNGMLLRDQLEIDLALQKLDLLLDEIGDPLDNTRSFSRVDLVWQFRGDPGLLINAHRNCRHKNIRADPLCSERGSLTWAGSQVRIRFYDKLRQMTKKPGDVIRVEVQLRGSLLRERFGSDFDECYKVYRQVLLGFCLKLGSRKAAKSLTGARSSLKSWAGMIRAPAALEGGFKNCCLHSGQSASSFIGTE